MTEPKVLYSKKIISNIMLANHHEILAVVQKDCAFTIFNHMWKHREIYFQHKQIPQPDTCFTEIYMALLTLPVSRFAHNVIDERDNLRERIADLEKQLKEKDTILNKLLEHK